MTTGKAAWHRAIVPCSICGVEIQARAHRSHMVWSHPLLGPRERATILGGVRRAAEALTADDPWARFTPPVPA
jgi:hypothetical protein